MPMSTPRIVAKMIPAIATRNVLPTPTRIAASRESDRSKEEPGIEVPADWSRYPKPVLMFWRRMLLTVFPIRNARIATAPTKSRI